MFDYVKDAGLRPREAYSLRSRTELIVLHHVEGDLSVRQVHQLHLERGHRGIDYNIYIDRDGTVYWGRGLQYEGGHTLNSGVSAGVNAKSVGIVCNGNFMREHMRAAQLEALCRVTLDVARHYGLKPEAVRAHREVGSTDCPGKYFPLEEVRGHVRQSLYKSAAMYETAAPAPVYKKERTIGAGVPLMLECYTGGEYARVKNPKTGSIFIVPFACLKKV